MASATLYNAKGDQLQDAVAHAERAWREGELVIFPTETLYGISAWGSSEAGMTALRHRQGFDQNSQFALHLARFEDVAPFVDLDSPGLAPLLRKLLAGPVTAVVDVTDATIASAMAHLKLPLEAADRFYLEHTVALRVPSDATAKRVLGAIEAPVVAGAVAQNGKAVIEGQTIPDDAIEAAGVVIDGGRTRYAKGSTLVRVRTSRHGPTVVVVREGVLDERSIRKMAKYTILMVCSGNTCRSPMAEGVARKLVAEKRDLPIEDLEAAGIHIISAGTYGGTNAPASREAVQAARAIDVDISGHRSQSLTPELIHEADVIFCMTKSHRQAILAFAPAVEGKTFLLDEGSDVSDPIGGDISHYEATLKQIAAAVEKRIEGLQV